MVRFKGFENTGRLLRWYSSVYTVLPGTKTQFEQKVAASILLVASISFVHRFRHSQNETTDKESEVKARNVWGM